MPVKQLRHTYQLKVVLNGTKPPIWRRIHVSSTISLGKLHLVLQLAMGWTNSHLHQFISGSTIYGIIDDEFSFNIEDEDENKYKLNQLLKHESDIIIYEYDFGDGWEHKVILEKILPYKKDMQSAYCIKGKMACPPEDCGGIWGFQNLLEVLKEPKHPEYEEMLEWLGDEYDSKEFDINIVNEMLAEYAG